MMDNHSSVESRLVDGFAVYRARVRVELHAGDLEVLLGSLVPATVEGWEGRFGELQTTDIDTSCSQQPFFTVVPAG